MEIERIILNILPAIIVAIILGAFNFFKRGDKTMALLEHRIQTLETKVKDQDNLITKKFEGIEDSVYKDTQRLASVEEELKHLITHVEDLASASRDQFKTLQTINESLVKISTELSYLKKP